MKLLLDTHIWIWAVLEPKRLSARVAREIQRASNQLWLSPVSLWELVVLVKKKRLDLYDEPTAWANKALGLLPVQEAVVTHDIALATQSLDLPHHDPADRFLVATAKILALTLVTADDRLKRTKDCTILLNR